MLRSALARNVSGEPSSRTTRRLLQRLPGVRPRGSELEGRPGRRRAARRRTTATIASAGEAAGVGKDGARGSRAANTSASGAAGRRAARRSATRRPPAAPRATRPPASRSAASPARPRSCAKPRWRAPVRPRAYWARTWAATPSSMHPDAFAAARGPAWDELAELTSRSRRRSPAAARRAAARDALSGGCGRPRVRAAALRRRPGHAAGRGARRAGAAARLRRPAARRIAARLSRARLLARGRGATEAADRRVAADAGRRPCSPGSGHSRSGRGGRARACRTSAAWPSPSTTGSSCTAPASTPASRSASS